MKGLSRQSPLILAIALGTAGLLHAGTFVANTPLSVATSSPDGGSLTVRISGTASYQGIPDSNDINALIQTAEEDTRPNSTLGNGKTYQGPFAQGQIIQCTTNACMGWAILPISLCPQRLWYRGRNDAIIYHQYNPEVSSVWNVQRPTPCEDDTPPGCFQNPEGSLRVLSVVGNPRGPDIVSLDEYLPSRTELAGPWRHLMDDWAMVSLDPLQSPERRAFAVLGASTPEFSSRLTNGQWSPAPDAEAESGHLEVGVNDHAAGAQTTVALVVGAPIHPLNERWIPLPVVTFDRSIQDPSSVPGLAVVRAVQDHGLGWTDIGVLWSDREVGASEREYLGKALGVEYQGERVHRVVLFAVVGLGADAGLVKSLSITPDCCCEAPPGCQ